MLIHKLQQIELSSSTAKITFTKISPKGEAELMIRKGKQAIIYEYEVEVEFRAENSQNEVEGSFKINDIN
jgi:activator of HSP90 ATPase